MFFACGGGSSSSQGTPNPQDSFIPVTDISGVNTAATAGIPFTLTGAVEPSDATNQTIEWSVENQGMTGATISGNTLNTTAIGTATVRATITNGLAAGTDFTKTFTISVAVLVTVKYITGGAFMMGSPGGAGGEPNRYTDETQHSATVSSFYMGIYPVTQAQYKMLMGYNPSSFQGTNLPVGLTNGDNLPVEQVTWYDAAAFCNELSDLEGLQKVYTITGITKNTDGNIAAATVTATFANNGYRLPTEAEWEYACRGDYPSKATETATNPFGVSDGTKMTYELANFYTSRPYDLSHTPSGDYTDSAYAAYPFYLDSTSEVGRYGANNYGLYDMHGNVWEWCWDWYSSTYPASPPADYDGPVSGTSRVERGGSWGASGQELRSACRAANNPGNWYGSVGFRVVRRP